MFLDLQGWDALSDLGDGVTIPDPCVENSFIAPYTGPEGWRRGGALDPGFPEAQVAATRAQAAWKKRYPKAPPLDAFIVKAKGNTSQIKMVRPNTAFDPELDGEPVIPKGDPRMDIFNAAMILFYPDFMFNEYGDSQVKFGTTLTKWGPFPLRRPMVNEAMMQFIVDYMKRPDAFGSPSVVKQFDVASEALGAAGEGFAAGSSLTPVMGAIVGAATFLWSAISSMLSERDKPAWAKKLLEMELVREKGSGRSFSGDVYPGICSRISVSPPAGAKYTLLEGYTEVLRRMNPNAKSGLRKAAPTIVGGGIALLLSLLG